MMNEKISSLIDGELDAQAVEALINVLQQEANLRESCELYWLVGDALRGSDFVSMDLSSRVMRSLEYAPVVLAPRPMQAPPKIDVADSGRWMPLAAAVAGVGVAVWMGLSLMEGGTTPQFLPALAQQNEAAQVGSVGQATNDVLDDQSYLMAHQASAMGSPMPGVAQYVRTVRLDDTGLGR